MEEQLIRGYHRISKSWYANKNEDTEVMFGMYSKEGGCRAEMKMQWIELGEPTPQLKSFNDSWELLSEFKDLIDELAKHGNKRISEEKFCSILDKLGFKDLTDYESPYKDAKGEVKTPKQIADERDDLLSALNSLRDVEPWISDVEMKRHFQKTVYTAIEKATS